MTDVIEKHSLGPWGCFIQSQSLKQRNSHVIHHYQGNFMTPKDKCRWTLQHKL